jgi:hypothetical protein
MYVWSIDEEVFAVAQAASVKEARALVIGQMKSVAWERETLDRALRFISTSQPNMWRGPNAEAVLKASGEVKDLRREADRLSSAYLNQLRYERAFRAIRDCTLVGTEFGEWVQCVCEDVLDGAEAECWNCGTVLHEGPCVGEAEE